MVFSYKRGYCDKCGKRTTKKIEDKFICTSCAIKLVNDKKVLIFSDVHIPYEDAKAILALFKYIKSYKPDLIYINGDLIDFYNLSTFDQCPDRRANTAEELERTKHFLSILRATAGDECEIVYLHGNHENRLQRFMWSNPEMASIDALSLKNLLDLDKYNIQEVEVNRDYWSKETGHAICGDMVIMHGDNRLNGGKTSQYAGYSVKGTMLNGLQQSVAIGHIHRLAIIHHTTPYNTLIGLEGGCLCQLPKSSNWQQGFITFTLKGERTYNHRLHRIEDGVLI